MSPPPRVAPSKSRARTKSPARRATRGGVRLIISEKQIAAERIASILGGGKAAVTRSGPVPIYRFEAPGGEWRVVGLSGHVVQVDYPSALNRWHLVNPRDLIFAEPIKKVPRGAKALVDALRKAADGATEIVVATDFDREGELIGLEAVELVQGKTPAAGVRRARFSSLTPKDVRQAFENLVDLDRNLAAAGESRQLVDLAWGAVLTRIITMAARQGGREVLSVGRVQSPTLALLVDLERQIKAFQPRPYWLLSANVGAPPGFEAFHLGPAARAGAEEPEPAEPSEADEAGEAETRLPPRAFPTESEAQRIYEAIREAKEATVEAVDAKGRTEPAPTPFNTTEFLRAAAALGVSAGRAMELAELLYMRGFISYPRTDNTVYPPTEDLNAILDALVEARAFADDVRYLAAVRRPEPTRGKKTATDHPPIHPVDAARPSDLSELEWRIYELVVRRFLATLAQDARGESLRVDLAIREEPFRATGYRVEFAGWKQLYPYAGSQERLLPTLRAGERIPVHEIHLQRHETQPPKRYGQGRLIAEMERLGLGTKSTRHDIIEKLVGRHYVKGAKSLEPTETGFAVTDALERYAAVITRPDMTARLEEEMELVAQGEKKLAEVVADSRQLLEQAVAILEENREKLGAELSAALTAQNMLGPCPVCGKPLVVVRGRTGKRFVGCKGYPECRQTYPLPQYGRLVPTGRSCDACAAPIVRLLTAGRPPWELCVNFQCPKRADRAPTPPDAPAVAEGGD